ncbi:MAG: KH domain-containing protein [Candidatus Nomurabacteria bacterium]|nr:MAG: KH domain-containing protein [Candidatus Nomurabacteria bacterium]HRV76207.1 KH domain-containing protein [Candidatus Saccharimonadales bacterium]
MSEITIDQQFVEYIAKSLVDNEADVKVERVVDERGVLLTLYVNPADLGRVIGKRGAIAESIRTLLRSLGIKNSAHYNLKIADTDGGSNSTREEVQEQDYSQYASRRTKIVENSQSEDQALTEEEPTKESDFVKNTRQELADLED